MSDTISALVACPFCGAGKTLIHENGKVWAGMRYSEPTSVSVQHWCDPVPGQPSRMIERVGRDEASAVAAWNTRAAPSTPAAHRKCDIRMDDCSAQPDSALRCMTCGEWRSTPCTTPAAQQPQPSPALTAAIDKARGRLEARLAEQEAETDVRRILMAVVPGEDGMGEEVYAKSVDEVVAKLTELGEAAEELASLKANMAAQEVRQESVAHRAMQCPTCGCEFVDGALHDANVALARAQEARQGPVAPDVRRLVAAELERISDEPPISGNNLARARVLIASNNLLLAIASGPQPPQPVALTPKPGAVLVNGALVCCEELDREPCPHQPERRCKACPGGGANGIKGE